MLHITDNGSSCTRDDYIIQALTEARGILLKFARDYRLDFDDLQQEAALVVLEVLDRALAAERPRAYLQGAIRKHFFKMLTLRGASTISLDAPLSDENGACLADLLPAQVIQADAAADDRAYRREQALHDALHRLPLEEQTYMRRVYGLNAFNPVPHDRSYRPRYDRPDKNVSRHAYKWLRRDQALAAAL